MMPGNNNINDFLVQETMTMKNCHAQIEEFMKLERRFWAILAINSTEHR